MSDTQKMRTALSIAGSDCSGGAGIQADLKTMLANGVYGMSAITALTAQNTTGVFDVMEVTPHFLFEQIKACAEDIFPDAVKTGMISSPELIEVCAKCIKEFGLKNIVVDPVMVATSGSRLVSKEAVSALCDNLFPLADVITPNIPEAEVLCGQKILSARDMESAAAIILNKFGGAVLLKGGHSLNDANDFLLTEQGGSWIKGKRIDNPNTHGTGCTLSSAIAANLAKGCDIKTSVEKAKVYISQTLAAGLNLGKGSGPLNHGAGLLND
ncbi:bifunctional hydroxymethylpyrimidine kinase/phosphomethylpyrimidine kinase [uncultured Treponema sp.]|uniref:bifunctional hydroxymethylpyrimidine kinase/phosphomethylpyrimidine kinase n=1 Tax=uncultured Treponema sp. TaxID=162155 RepID=UPI0027D9CA23|nr:bifunctional hydroxymethylpyrimidine kinase/phosphomethylpyrimidine kinase [uncultured Treponema sp.]